ncbi:dTDP-4-dehydrorhamnose 3,5-epimerase [Ralstonia mannitolilytica]|nr:dTDP-4-dehydrorhamnose 3,5-epimerase [Ralstonia mannitolilytica]
MNVGSTIVQSTIMRSIPTAIPDVLLIEPVVHTDARGFFFESFNQRVFSQATGLDPVFVQDNYTRSHRGVLRGLHFQVAPHAQAKLVRAVRGEVFDVVVDVRPASPHFGKWVGIELSENNHRQLWVPAGMAHGFLVLSEIADVHYKVTDYYCPNCQRSMAWNDPVLDIAWPIEMPPVLSAADACAMSWADLRREQLATEPSTEGGASEYGL